MSDNSVDMDTPWYKQFWPWFLIFLPGSVVVASIITIILAVNNADSLVVEDYYQQALHINRDLRKIEYAKKIGLTGTLSIIDKALSLEISVQKNKIKLAPALKLLLVHPTDSKKDFRIMLVQSQQAVINSKSEQTDNVIYYAQTNDEQRKQIKNSAWYVRLISPDNIWQLNGKIKGIKKTIPLYAD